MKQRSIWFEQKKSNFKSLQKDIEIDILIIGGGITGVTTAFYLKDVDQKIALVEQDKIGYGVTSKTTGKVTYLQECIYQKLENNYNKNIATRYLESQKEAISLIKNNIENYGIDCSFERVPSYVFTHNKKEIKIIQEEKTFLKSNHSKVKEVETLPIELPISYGIKVEDTYVFHPLKYLDGLVKQLKNIEIYEHTKVTNIETENDRYVVTANQYRMKTKKIVLACHYPFFLFPYLFPMKTTLERSYIVSGFSKNKHFSAITSKNPTESIRYHNDQVIYLSNSALIGSKIDTEKEFQEVKQSFENLFLEKPTQAWLNEDIMTLDSLPLIGYVKKDNKNLLIGTGYNTWGMTNGTIAGKILSDLITEKENAYQDLFNPNRKMNFEKVKNGIFYNIWNVKNFIKSKLIKNPNFYKENIKVIYEDGIAYGIYTDNKGIEHKVYNTCPHMKCSLVFNEQEKTWDCPCHASRFDIDGNSIKGPSKYDIKIKRDR